MTTPVSSHNGELVTDLPGWLRPLGRGVQALDRGLGRVDRYLLALCCAIFAAIVVVVLTAVFFRYVLNSSLMWGEELARYLSVWLVFLGLSCAHRRSEHVSLTSLLGRLPKISPHAARVVGELITLCLCLVVAYYGAQATASNFGRHQVSPALRIEIAWIYMAIPAGFALLSLQSFVRLFKNPHEEERKD